MKDLQRRVKEWKEISRPDFIGTHELIDDLLKATHEMETKFTASLPEYVEPKQQNPQPPGIVWQRIDDEAKTGQQVHIWYEEDGESKTVISRWLEKEQRWVKLSKGAEVLGYQPFPQPPKQEK